MDIDRNASVSMSGSVAINGQGSMSVRLIGAREGWPEVEEVSEEEFWSAWEKCRKELE